MSNERISLIVPIYNEENSIEDLVKSINQQTFKPAEVILVDGNSSDNTVDITKNLIENDKRFKLIKSDQRATPGKGRNIGVKNARNEWIAFTDAGIELKNDWLENLVKETRNDLELDIVYGNYSPIINTFFEKCASLSYVPPLRKDSIRGKSIVSCLLRKKVWEDVEGFPDLRAAEDLIFMEQAEEKGYKFGFAPEAMAHWQLRPDLLSTFKKFVLYSKHNVWAGRQWDWHYGILRQYLILLPFLLLVAFHSWWWLFVFVLWLFARTAKRILPHRFEFGQQILFNPFIWLTVSFIILVIDLATFIGWGQAKLSTDE